MVDKNSNAVNEAQSGDAAQEKPSLDDREKTGGTKNSIEENALDKENSTQTRMSGQGFKRALVVGINNYNNFNDLPSCVADAEKFSEILIKKYGFLKKDIVLLTDDAVDGKNFRAALKNLFINVSAKDRIVLFFSGHGTTQLKGGILQECLVLQDEFLLDDELVSASNDIPGGVLTAVIDACYSGGMNKQLMVGVVSDGVLIDHTRVKAFTRTTASAIAQHNEDKFKAKFYKRFGERVVPLPPRIEVENFGGTLAFKNLIPAPPSDEVTDAELNGLLISASMETEVAAASTRDTQGLSAFTFALVSEINKYGPQISANALVEAIQTKLKSMGFAQLPLLKAPATYSNIGSRSFLLFEEPTQIDSMALSAGFSETLRSLLGGNVMNSQLVQVLSAISDFINNKAGGTKGTSPQKFIGLDDAIALAAIIAAATKGQLGGAEKSTLGDVIRAAGGLIKGEQPQQKAIGIDDAIALAAIIAAATKGQLGAAEKSTLGDVIRAAGGLIKGEQPQQKAIGIDDAIALAAIIAAATKGQLGGTEKSTLGEVIRAAGGLIKGEQPQQKAIGIDDAIALAAIIAAATKGELGGVEKSTLGDVIRAAGGLIKGEQPQQKAFSIYDWQDSASDILSALQVRPNGQTAH